MATQTRNGKTFEYACLCALLDACRMHRPVSISVNSAFENAERDYAFLETAEKHRMQLAAEAAARSLFQFEPMLTLDNRSNFGATSSMLELRIQADSAGQKGDVRDVILRVPEEDWEIGLSCKNNHKAVKHSRLSNTIDFGLQWLGIPASPIYFAEIKPIFDRLAQIRSSSGATAVWSVVGDKEEEIYAPVLEAFRKELLHLNDQYENVAAKLVSYLFGHNDFYKVIKCDAGCQTEILPVNLYGTLGKSVAGLKGKRSAKRILLPTKIYAVEWERGRKNTLSVVMDEGWQISLRIHNASSRVEPSLKFDVQQISIPASMTSFSEMWEQSL